MLPERSKRFASPDGEIPRRVLTGPWQLALIGLMVLTLLATIFPHKALVESLYQQEQLDTLTLSYIQNLYRTEPGNADVALLLARTRPESLQNPSMQATLQQLSVEGSPRQRREARRLLLSAYLQQLAQSHGEPERIAVRKRLIDLLAQARNDALTLPEAQTLAEQAFALDQPALGMQFFDRLGLGHTDQTLERLGDTMLSQGRHALAASYYQQARERADSLDQERRLFQKGIQTYMQASMFDEAMQAAQQHLGDLAYDLPTLRFLARTALAAGKPALASDYARRLVFVLARQERP